jgi:hypothetical protein
MAHNFGLLVFTPVIKALQEREGSRRQYENCRRPGRHPSASANRSRSLLTPRFTEEQIRDALTPIETRMQEQKHNVANLRRVQHRNQLANISF